MLSSEQLQDIKSRFGIIGNAEGLNRAIERAYQVAPTDYSVLVVGESGVGKEFFPKIIHANSTRKHAPYIAINCGAIPNGTIDSELFGHVKGSFTGATNDHKGYFEEANGGTIFLDEVGELPLETQVRLLRVLETGEFLRVGSSTVQKTNVRVVAATNLNMQSAVQQGKFREDLFYRLSTITINVPALRERKEDIPILFRKFASDCCERYKMPPLRLTDDARMLLQNYYFRGNIRQLKNIAEQICVLEQRREISASILRQYLPQEESWTTPVLANNFSNRDADYQKEREFLYKVLFDMKRELDELKQKVQNNNTSAIISHITNNDVKEQQPKTDIKEPIRITQSDSDDEWQQAEEVNEEEVSRLKTNYEQENLVSQPSTITEMEKDMIRQALIRHKGNRRLAAEQLQMSERTLYRKIKEYDL